MIVIGDHIIDKYIFGTAKRLSPEAPVPVITEATEITKSGGASLVVQNLEALGTTPTLIHNPNQKTEKTRIVADGHIVCRLDVEEYEAFEIDFNKHDLSTHKTAVLVDYNKGVLHYAHNVIKFLNQQGVRCFVDMKKPFDHYQNAWLVKCNKKEFEEFAKVRFYVESADYYCAGLCRNFGFNYIVVTLGADGCYVYNDDSSIAGEGTYIPTEKQTVVDVTGAGDVFMAALAHFSMTESIEDAAKKANKLAGISVSHLGTYVLTKDDIDKVKNKIVFTNGCFDILHPGHIHLLNESKKLGNKLIIGLNSDASINRLKGSNRPILTQDRRKKMLEALGIADDVIIFEEDTPLELIKKIEPDIITKGGDYKYHEVVGYGLAEIVIISTLENYSTTGVINEIVRKS